MKIGIVSDIHADPTALLRALEDMPSTDVLLCPGDAVSEYRFCPETVEILQQARVLCIQGNHELVLFGGRNPAYLKKCQANFAANTLDFLATAPVSRELEFDGTKILLVHASPWEPYDEYIYPGSVRLASFATLAHDLVCFGHTHVPLLHEPGLTTVTCPAWWSNHAIRTAVELTQSSIPGLGRRQFIVSRLTDTAYSSRASTSVHRSANAAATPGCVTWPWRVLSPRRSAGLSRNACSPLSANSIA